MVRSPIRQFMFFPELQLLDENPNWRCLLQAYLTKTLEAAEARAVERKQAKAAAQQSADQTEVPTETEEELSDTDDDSESFAEARWLSRLQKVEGVEADELSSVHGNLIAYGFLKFKLAGRDGLVYMLTTLGRRGAEPADENAQDVADDALDDVAEDSLEEAA